MAQTGFEALSILCFTCLYSLIWNVPLCFGAQTAEPYDFGISYEIKIEGAPGKKLLDELESVSDTVSFKARPPASVNLLQRRVERDRVSFLKILKAQGYYGAQVEADINLKVKPVQVIFHINNGPLYLLKAVEFKVTGEEEASQQLGFAKPWIRNFGTLQEIIKGR